jgi:Xaa-Pro aminopeptidase
VTTATNRKLGRGELYLVDSGGQYRDGTTDITRTVASAQAKRRDARPLHDRC